MSGSPKISISHEVESIHLFPGQTLTVYMGGSDKAAQVELRCFPNGMKEVWAPTEVDICDWELGHWTPME